MPLSKLLNKKSLYVDSVLDYLDGVLQEAALPDYFNPAELGWSSQFWPEDPPTTVIFGGVGTGKSSVLKHEAARLAREAKENIEKGGMPDGQAIPLRLSLARRSLSPADGGEVGGALIEAAAPAAGAPLRQFLTGHLQTGRCVLLLDDWHVAEPNTRRLVGGWLARLGPLCPRLLLAARRFGGGGPEPHDGPWPRQGQAHEINMDGRLAWNFDSYLKKRLGEDAKIQLFKSRLCDAGGIDKIPLAIDFLCGRFIENPGLFEDQRTVYKLCVESFHAHSLARPPKFDAVLDELSKGAWERREGGGGGGGAGDAEAFARRCLELSLATAEDAAGGLAFQPGVEEILANLYVAKHAYFWLIAKKDDPSVDKEKLKQYLPIVRSGLRSDPGRGYAACEPGNWKYILDSYFPRQAVLGRDEELELLDWAWHRPEVKMLSIIGPGGEGKTALVSRWAYKLIEEAPRKPRKIFAWSFRANGDGTSGAATLDEFIKMAFQHFGGTADGLQQAWRKGERLAELIGEDQNVLILDGLEAFQNSAGEIQNYAVKALLEGLQKTGQGLCLVTSQTPFPPPPEGGPEGRSAPTYHGSPRYELDSLPHEFALDLLQNFGVRGAPESLGRWLERVQRHALTVRLMGDYVKSAHGGDCALLDAHASAYEDAKRLLDGSRRRVERAADERRFWERWFMEKHDEWLQTSGDWNRKLRAVLRTVCLFDKPAQFDDLAEFCQNSRVEGLTDALADTPPPELENIVEELRGRGEPGKFEWLSVNRRTEARPGGERNFYEIDTRKEIREFFRAQLRHRQPKTWREAHSKLMAHFNHPRQYQVLDDRNAPVQAKEAAVERLYQAVYHGCMAEEYQKAYLIHAGKVTNSAHALALASVEMGVLKWFFSRDSSPRNDLPPLRQACLCGSLSFCCETYGDMNKAIAYRRREYGLASLQQKLGDPDGKAAREMKRAGNKLVELLLVTGDLTGAQKQAEAAESIKLEDCALEIQRLVNLAAVLHRLGDIPASGAQFTRADEMQMGWHNLARINGVPNPPENNFLAYVEGTRHWAFLIDTTEPITDLQETVMKRCNRAEAFASSDETDRALYCLTRGRYHFAKYAYEETEGNLDQSRAELDQSLAELDKAVHMMEKSHRIDFMPRVLWARALVLRKKNRHDDALKDAERTLEISQGTGMRLYEVEGYLVKGNILLDRLGGGAGEPADWEDAKNCYERARELVEEIHYKLREPELYMLKARIELRADKDSAKAWSAKAKDAASAMQRHTLLRNFKSLEKEFL